MQWIFDIHVYLCTCGCVFTPYSCLLPSVFRLWVCPSEGRSDWSWVVGGWLLSACKHLLRPRHLEGSCWPRGLQPRPSKAPPHTHSKEGLNPSGLTDVWCQGKKCPIFATNLLCCFFLSPAPASPSFPPSEGQFGVLHRRPRPLHHAERFHVRQRVRGRGARPEAGCLPQAAVPERARLLLRKSRKHTHAHHRRRDTNSALQSQDELRRRRWNDSNYRSGGVQWDT